MVVNHILMFPFIKGLYFLCTNDPKKVEFIINIKSISWINHKIVISFLQHFRQFLRIKDGNEDEPETEIGENFEILLQFVLDCRQLPAAEVIEKYFVEDSTLSLSNNPLRKELKSGSKDPEKLEEAEDDVKNVSAIKSKSSYSCNKITK